MEKETPLHISRNEQETPKTESPPLMPPSVTAKRSLRESAYAEYKKQRDTLNGLLLADQLSEEETKEAASRLSEIYGAVSPEEAQEIMGDALFFGPEAVTQVFGTAVEDVPAVPFSRETANHLPYER